MNAVWIIGAGRFGRRAALELFRKSPDADVLVVDHNPAKLEILQKHGIKTVCTDGVAFLAESLVEPGFPDWIIPAVPLHVAYAWVRERMSSRLTVTTIEIPESLVKLLPNPFRGKNRAVYVSVADFLCPDDCPEPAEICTHTGKARPLLLYRWLQNLRHDDFCSIVVRSRQLSPGVGGYRPQALFDALESAVAADSPVLLSTACRCHGVMHAFLPGFAVQKNRVDHKKKLSAG